MIPIFNINKNQLTSLHGEVSTFFELLPPDMEGRNEIDTEQMIKSIEEAIINTNGVFKLYKLNNKIYLNQFGEIELPQAKLIKENEPMRVLIEDDEVDIHYYENYFTQGIRLLNYN